MKGDEVGELIGCIIGMYFFSKTKNLYEYLHKICEQREIPLLYRIECAKNVEKGYPHLDKMFMSEAEQMLTLPTPVRVDTLLFLMKYEEYKDVAREYFCHIILDENIDSLYRYRTIQSLETHFKDNEEMFLYYARESCIRFMKMEKTFTYRVISCQYLLEKCKPSPELHLTIEIFLLQVADDVSLSEDIRADACDILLQYAGDEGREKARNALFILGGRDRNNIFKNRQNVHVRSIEESVEKIAKVLSTHRPQSGIYYTFEQARDAIMNLSQHYNESVKHDVEGALIRITIDRAVYGSTNLTLTGALSKIWTHIQDSEFREELETRLIEELVDSINKCSSGYMARLVSVFSGYIDHLSITISFEDQIIANLEARLNSAIMKMDDEYEMSAVMEEMIIPVIHFHLRGNFLKFFREHISFIREEMYQEFRTYMEDIDFDFYFRKAIIHYEGC